MIREYLNTLYVSREDAVVCLEGDTLQVLQDGKRLAHVPLHHLGSLVLFGNSHITGPALMRCAEDGRHVVFLSRTGRFKARVEGPTTGNVLLRLAQFRGVDDPEVHTPIVRNIIAGKIRNQRNLLNRGARDATDEQKAAALRSAVARIDGLLLDIEHQSNVNELRVIEGVVAQQYFEVFGHLISDRQPDFAFHLRSRRPPRDRMNALLSFLYAMLQSDCTAAICAVGLDPQVGFLHVLRPGRPSLALDLMEEFRPLLADRLALTLVNRNEVTKTDFVKYPGGGVMLNDVGRKKVVIAYQERKKVEHSHPFLKEDVPLGLMPYLQARLFARVLRGDLLAYPPAILKI